MAPNFDIVVSIIGLSLSAVIAIASAIVYRISPKLSKVETYEDRDGTATEESWKKYSVRIHNILLTSLTLSGFVTSLALAFISWIPRRTSGPYERWLVVGIWALLGLQRSQSLRARHPITYYRLTGCEAVTFLSTSAVCLILVHSTFESKRSRPSDLVKALSCTNMSLAILGFSVAVCVPRRPIVYHHNRPIDGQLTVSTISRLTFAWPSKFLALSASGKKVTFDDFPSLGRSSRAWDLYDRFNQISSRGGSLVKRLLLAYLPVMAVQYTLTLIDAALMLAPQYAMYRILRLLELRDAGAKVTTTAIFWVLGLGLVVIAGNVVNNWTWWLNFTGLHIPLRAQLSAVIFAKAMRRKDVKGSGGSEKPAAAMGGEEALSGQPQAEPEKDTDPNKDLEENMRKTRQGVINLIGVDTKRIADFSSVNHVFFGSACRLAVSFTFLGQLVGWKPLLTGIAVQLLFLPINIYFSKKYTEGQEVLMKLRDRKLAVLNEALNGIRQIKFAAIERQWRKKILDVREEELNSLWKTFVYDTVLIGLWLTGPVVLSAAVIVVYAVVNGALPPSVAFTTISILSQIEGTLAWLPELTTNLLDAYVSLKRIDEYLRGPEKTQLVEPGQRIEFKNATIAWPTDADSTSSSSADDRFALRSVNASFPRNALSIISGRTGSGKSLMLAALLGEIDLLDGSIITPFPPPRENRHDDKANRANWIVADAFAFVSQQPWIENATFKNNVLFGLPYDEERYRKVISACALDKDLEILTDRDETEIGANGINLSGGQRWRVTLARALYSRAGILVLDDVFSAVDTHVGRHIYEEAIMGSLCKGRTVILVTHHVGLVREGAKYEVCLANGTVEYVGDVQDKDEAVVEDEVTLQPPTAEDRMDVIRRFSSRRSGRNRRTSEANGSASGKGRRTSSQADSKPDFIDDGQHAGDSKAQQPRKFVEDEKTESGWIKWRVYAQYLDACGGWPFWIGVGVAFGGYEALLLGRSWVLKLWTEHAGYESSSIRVRDHFSTTAFYIQDPERISSPYHLSADNNSDLKFYLTLYLGFAFAICVEGTLRYLWVFHGSIKASRKLFEQLTNAVLYAPLRWLDTMPVGRVLNRFTADFNQTDGGQAYAIGFAIYNVLLLAGVMVAGTIVSPYIVLVALLLLGLCSRYALYYIATAREVKRLESIAKSPIFEHFSQALAGVSTIRAFDKTEAYIATMFDRIDTHARTVFYQLLLNRWLSWRLAVIGAMFAVIVASIVVTVKGMDASLGGFALGFTLQYTEGLMWLIRDLSQVELNMNATERIIEYSEIETEDKSGEDPPASWPSDGRLKVDGLEVGYAPDLPPVLKNLSFVVNKNERVGVVGRTGAGKSSLTLALFRFLEARKGSIYIDGIDISKIKLHELRGRLAIIPQDPVLFSGNVRSNLDPFDEHDDRELLDALERVHLIESAPPTASASSTALHSEAASAEGSGAATPRPRNPSLNLSTSVSESGLNLSQGQRQLLCLARAIVSRPKIMVLDEATSAVDKQTDSLIQRSIREEFRDATLVVIAHRLSTIADFDRLLVLDKGEAVEYDKPRVLLEKEEGVFRKMVESSGEKDVLMEIIMGDLD